MLSYLVATASIVFGMATIDSSQDARPREGGAAAAAQEAKVSERPKRVSRSGSGRLEAPSRAGIGKSPPTARRPRPNRPRPLQARPPKPATAPELLKPPTAPPTDPDPAAGSRAATRARSNTANDLAVFRSTIVAQAGFTAAEPHAANDRNVILATGNTYAAVSEDNGLTFSTEVVDPDDDELYGGACCDQLAYSVERDDYQLIFWLVQDRYEESAKRNALRLYMFRGRGDLLAGEPACGWTFEPRDFDLDNKTWFDFNQISHTPKYLYLTTNVRDFAGEKEVNESPRVGGLIFRSQLDDLDDGDCSISFYYWYEHGNPYISPVQNAGHTMYLATQVKKGLEGNNLRIYSVVDGTSDLEKKDKDIENFDDIDGKCVLPDGTNPCDDQHDGRMSGFHSGDTVGWLWMADQDKHYPMPYVRVAVFEVGSKKKILEHSIWNETLAWQVPTVGVNGRGELGVVLYAMGKSRFPSAHAFIRTNPRDWSGIEVTTLAQSDSSGQGADPTNSWGHYGGVQPYIGCDKTFLASVYTSQSEKLMGEMVWFGHPSSGCVDLAAKSIAVPPGRSGNRSFTLGDRIDVSATVENQGSATAAASSLGFYLSIDRALSDNDISFGVTRSIDALEPGERQRRETKVKLPETGPAKRDYYVLACADDPDEIGEITIANNCAASRGTIQVGTAPDLVMESVSFGAAAGRSFLSGDTLDVTTRIRNGGSVLASASFIGYYLSTDRTRSEGDVSFGTTRAANALDPGEKHRLTATLNLPTVGKIARDYYVIACADDVKDLRELDNKNNCAATDKTISVSSVVQVP